MLDVRLQMRATRRRLRKLLSRRRRLTKRRTRRKNDYGFRLFVHLCSSGISYYQRWIYVSCQHTNSVLNLKDFKYNKHSSFVEGTEQISDLSQTALRELFLHLNHFNRVLRAVTLLRSLHLLLFLPLPLLLPVDLQSLLQSMTCSLRILEVESSHLDVLVLHPASQLFVLFETVLIVCHNRTVLFLIRFEKDDIH